MLRNLLENKDKTIAPIEWLRAFSVISVIIFHYNKDFLPGGFLGVDVFLVISGYLVGGHIINRLLHNNFYFMDFFFRRFWRLMPALLIVLLFSTVASVFTSTPEEFSTLSKSIIASFFGVSNIFFWFTSGYFTGSSDYNYILHTWSLSLEWQYYVLVALLASILGRFGAKNYIVLLFIIFIVSFSFCIVISDRSHSFGFYNLPSRLWEFVVGTFVYLLSKSKTKELYVSRLLMIFGFGLCIISVFIIDESNDLPGLLTILPVIGAAFVLYSADVFAKADNVPSNFLYTVGVLSYTLYLVHWPILVAFRTFFYSSFLGFFVYVIVLGCVAFFLHVYVERVFMNRYRRTVINSSFLISLFILCFPFSYYVSTHYFNKQLDPEEYDVIAAMESYNADRKNCLKRSVISFNNNNEETGCKHSLDKEKVGVVFWGDSHLEGLRAGYLGVTDSKFGFGFLGHAGCPPVIGVDREGNIGICSEAAGSVFRTISSLPVDYVVMGARFAAYIYGNTSNLGPAEGGKGQYIAVPDGMERSSINRLALLSDNLEDEIAVLVKQDKTVILVGGLPEYGVDIPRYYFERLRYGVPYSDIRPIELHLDVVRQRTDAMDNVLKSIAAKYKNVHYFDPKDILCPNSICRTILNGEILYFDDDHLNVSGSKLVYKSLIKLINFLEENK